MAVIVSVPLRFPFGSLTRAALVVTARLRAGRQFADGEIEADEYRSARETHTWLVAGVALIPGLGAGAFLLSPTMRRSANLIPLVVDQAAHKLPFSLYARLRVHRLTVARLRIPTAHALDRRAVPASPQPVAAFLGSLPPHVAVSAQLDPFGIRVEPLVAAAFTDPKAPGPFGIGADAPCLDCAGPAA